MIKIKTLPQKQKKYAKNRVILMGILAVFAGFVNGFLGTGGGIVLMAAFALMPPGDETALRDRFAMVIAVILPLSLISVIAYGDAISFESAAPYLLPGVLGGITGALLLDKINPKLLKKLFAGLLLFAGVTELFGGKGEEQKERKGDGDARA